MANRSKFKISKVEKKTKRGKRLYAINSIFVPEKIADSFTGGFFTVKQIGNKIIYSLIDESENN